MAASCSCAESSNNNNLQYGSGQMEAIMRACIVIGTLAVLAVSARIYTAYTQDRVIAGLNCTVDCSGYDAGYKWAKQHDIDDDDYCPDSNKSFYEGCAAYVDDNDDIN